MERKGEKGERRRTRLEEIEEGDNDSAAGRGVWPQVHHLPFDLGTRASLLPSRLLAAAASLSSTGKGLLGSDEVRSFCLRTRVEHLPIRWRLWGDPHTMDLGPLRPRQNFRGRFLDQPGPRCFLWFNQSQSCWSMVELNLNWLWALSLIG